MSVLRMVAAVVLFLALAACQTTSTGLGAAPQPIELAKVSGTYECTYRWLGYQTNGWCIQHFTVESNGTAVVTGTWSDSMGRSGAIEQHGTIDAATGKVELVDRGGGDRNSSTFSGYVREQDGAVAITGTITMGPDQASYRAKST